MSDKHWSAPWELWKFYFLRLFAQVVAIICSGWLAACGSSGSSAPPAPSITTLSIPDGTIGTAYSQTLQLTGGVPPFSWSVSSGDLPYNLTLGNASSAVSTISGVPDRVQSNVKFSITVTDAMQRSSTQSFMISIAGTPGEVITASGAVQGVASGQLFAYRGIPYAAPPIGDLRWKPPQPPASWSGVRGASKFGNVCPQIDGAGNYVGDEDCLVLNVFVAQKPPGPKLPVMVFLHGGGDQSGDTQYDPTALDAPPLVTQGVVVVTVEYRLGILGGLNHALLAAESGGNSGHYLLLDLIAALQWVQQNIAAFGGDPTHVLLFGQSAGAWDVQLLMAAAPAPAAHGLFSAAAMESGGLYKPGLFPSVAAAQASGKQFATAVGCAASPDVLACLRAIPAESLVQNPAADQDWAGPGVGSTFMPVDPFTYLQQRGSPVPLLIGSNREEWSIFEQPPIPTDAASYAAAIHTRFDSYGNGTTVGDQVLALYPVIDYSTPAEALYVVDSDFWVNCWERTLARATAGVNRPPVWRYLYTHAFENDPNEVGYGAFHTAELFFLFGNFNDGMQDGGGLVYTPSAADLTFSQALMGYWTRFAATGNPNGAGAVPWPVFDASDSMLQLDDTFMPITGYHNSQCDYLVQFE